MNILLVSEDAGEVTLHCFAGQSAEPFSRRERNTGAIARTRPGISASWHADAGYEHPCD